MTELVYLEDSTARECTALVKRVEHRDTGDFVVILSRTVFYPAGGGQPSDVGWIEAAPEDSANDATSALFKVLKARQGQRHGNEVEVEHIGVSERGNSLAIGDRVKVRIEDSARSLHSRLHSAGHLMDAAMASCGCDWTGGKGHHYPGEAYLEYTGVGDVDTAALGPRLEAWAQAAVDADEAVEVRRGLTVAEAQALCPEPVPEGCADGQVRVVCVGGRWGACGGTHVSRLGEIGRFKINKVKMRRGAVRISYTVEASTAATSHVAA